MSHTRITHKQNTLSFLATFLARNKDMAHLKYLRLRVSTSASSCPFLAAGLDVLQNAKQQRSIALNGWQNEHAKSWGFREMEAFATDAPWLTATAVAIDSRCHLPKRSLKWHMLTSKTLPAMPRQS